MITPEQKREIRELLSQNQFVAAAELIKKYYTAVGSSQDLIDVITEGCKLDKKNKSISFRQTLFSASPEKNKTLYPVLASGLKIEDFFSIMEVLINDEITTKKSNLNTAFRDGAHPTALMKSLFEIQMKELLNTRLLQRFQSITLVLFPGEEMKNFLVQQMNDLLAEIMTFLDANSVFSPLRVQCQLLAAAFRKHFPDATHEKISGYIGGEIILRRVAPLLAILSQSKTAFLTQAQKDFLKIFVNFLMSTSNSQDKSLEELIHEVNTAKLTLQYSSRIEDRYEALSVIAKTQFLLRHREGLLNILLNGMGAQNIPFGEIQERVTILNLGETFENLEDIFLIPTLSYAPDSDKDELSLKGHAIKDFQGLTKGTTKVLTPLAASIKDKISQKNLRGIEQKLDAWIAESQGLSEADEKQHLTKLNALLETLKNFTADEETFTELFLTYLNETKSQEIQKPDEKEEIARRRRLCLCAAIELNLLSGAKELVDFKNDFYEGVLELPPARKYALMKAAVEKTGIAGVIMYLPQKGNIPSFEGENRKITTFVCELVKLNPSIQLHLPAAKRMSAAKGFGAELMQRVRGYSAGKKTSPQPESSPSESLQAKKSNPEEISNELNTLVEKLSQKTREPITKEDCPEIVELFSKHQTLLQQKGILQKEIEALENQKKSTAVLASTVNAKPVTPVRMLGRTGGSFGDSFKKTEAESDVIPLTGFSNARVTMDDSDSSDETEHTVAPTAVAPKAAALADAGAPTRKMLAPSSEAKPLPPTTPLAQTTEEKLAEATANLKKATARYAADPADKQRVAVRDAKQRVADLDRRLVTERGEGKQEAVKPVSVASAPATLFAQPPQNKVNSEALVKTTTDKEKVSVCFERNELGEYYWRIPDLKVDGKLHPKILETLKIVNVNQLLTLKEKDNNDLKVLIVGKCAKLGITIRPEQMEFTPDLGSEPSKQLRAS